MCDLCFPPLNGKLYNGMDQVLLTMYPGAEKSAHHKT